MLPNPEEWPRYEQSALSAVVCGVDPDSPPGRDSSIEIEREKYDHYGIWKFGDASKGGWHHFGQYHELDVPYCLMIHFARTGNILFYRAAEELTRELLDVPAHGGGYGHQRGEPSHYYTFGPLLYSYVTSEPWLKESVRHSHHTVNPRPWHARSLAITLWSNLDMYFHFPENRPRYRAEMDQVLEWFQRAIDPKTRMLKGFDWSWQIFMLGMAGDALGRYSEAFPEDKATRERFVTAYKAWKDYVLARPAAEHEKLFVLCLGNGYAYAARLSGDDSLLEFAAEEIVRDSDFRPNYRTGLCSSKAWSEFGHRLTQVFLHDLDKKRHPEKYRGLP